MKITAKYLERMGACVEGVDTFQRCFPDGLGWTLQGQLAVLRSECRRYLGYAAMAGWVPLWRMSGIDLRKADLQKADLRWAILRGARLQKADLQGARLRGADFYGADLRSVNLREADLRGTDLQWANLEGANLEDIRHDDNTRWPEGFRK